MAKTLAVTEDTWEKLKKLVDSGEAKTFDELIRKMMDRSLGIPSSMYGIDKKRKIKLSLREHEQITRDSH